MKASALRNTLYITAVSIILLSVAIGIKVSQNKPRLLDNSTSPASDSQIDRIIHRAHYLSILKGSSSQSGVSSIKQTSDYFKTLLETQKSVFSGDDSDFLKLIISKIDLYSDYRTKKLNGLQDKIFWSRLAEGRFIESDISNEGVPVKNILSANQWWYTASVALSLNPLSRYSNLYLENLALELSPKNPETKMTSSHLLRGKCAWNPYGPPAPSCTGNGQAANNPPPANVEDPHVPLPSPEGKQIDSPEISHPAGIQQLFGSSVNKPQIKEIIQIVDGSKVSQSPHHLLRLFQVGGSHYVATALFLEGLESANFKTSVMICLEIIRLSVPMDAEDNLLFRFIELHARDKQTSDRLNLKSSQLSEQRYVQAAVDTWQL